MIGRIPPYLALLTSALLTASCGLIPGGSDDGSAGTASSASPGAGAPAAPAGPAREGALGLPAKPFRVTVTGVERRPEHTVLRAEIVSKDPESNSGQGTFGNRRRDEDFSAFELMDTAGKTFYGALRDGEGMAYGTRRDGRFEPGVRYPVQVYFPPLPATAKHVTVLAPGGLGEFAGIPVTEGGAGQAPQPSNPDATPAPGSVFTWPAVQPAPGATGVVEPLEEYVDYADRSKSKDGDMETIALRTDVLFAFDKAVLSGKAKGVLDEVVAETKERADPAKPPVIIEGHTDGKGGAAYNQRLSVRRAQAVHDRLAADLGSAYRYRVTGKGDREPIAANERKNGSDNPEGRARNRRVEISYQIKETTPGSTTTEAPDARTGSIKKPVFHADDGAVAGSVTQQTCCTRLRVDVHPFYREGAYLVGVFTMTNVGGRTHNTAYTPFQAWGETWSKTADFGALKVVDPKTKAVYHGLRAGKETFVEGQLTVLPAGQANRVFVYYPAPPDDVTQVSVTLEDGGSVKNVPVK